MPAAIKIVRGEAEETFPIEDAVFRVGSDPASKLRLGDPGIPAHVLTVEFRDGRYHVHNRAPVPLAIGGVAIRPNAAAVWPAGKELPLRKDLILRLEVSGDPKPGRVVDKKAEGASDSTEKSKEPAKKSSPAAAIVVVAAAAVIIAMMLLKASSKSEAPVEAPEPEFGKLIDDLRALKPTDDKRTQTLVDLLQAARAAQLASQPDDAVKNYTDAVTLLRKWQDELRGSEPASSPGGNPSGGATEKSGGVSEKNKGGLFDRDDQTNKVYEQAYRYARKRMNE